MSLPLPFYSPLTRPACFHCKIITALSTSRNQRTVKRPKLSSWQSKAGCVTQLLLLLLNNIFLRPAVPILEPVALDKPSTAPCLEDLGSQKLCGSFIIVGGGGSYFMLLCCRYRLLQILSVVMSLQSPGLSALIAASSVELMKYLLPAVCVFNQATEGSCLSRFKMPDPCGSPRLTRLGKLLIVC